MIRFDLRSQQNGIPGEELGSYNWRDYIWRSYEDAWIGRITFAKYAEGGYLLCMPDPSDPSITHILRLDYMGEPVEPSTLEDGVIKNVKKFDKLPSSAKPHVAFDITNKPTYKGIVRNSAQILFWGRDEEGNLHAYRVVRKC
ncbi:hypothetical protein GF359_10675 [candidate division WOR-3 bacterium]|uniref:Uncharacterized protein n=1 Tax=candidate division WOR-3 bacterium TaxID=2052148 RepID=A0A9D5KCP0_UNCW3|nr:hypothetical protein [candidate division WOR-3 bacterium]